MSNCVSFKHGEEKNPEPSYREMASWSVQLVFVLGAVIIAGIWRYYISRVPNIGERFSVADTVPVTLEQGAPHEQCDRDHCIEENCWVSTGKGKGFCLACDGQPNPGYCGAGHQNELTKEQCNSCPFCMFNDFDQKCYARSSSLFTRPDN